MFRQSIKKNKGFALIMTLLILSMAMLTGLFMNSIIVGEVRVSLNTANVINSYYAAESGIERALYYLTTNQLSNNIDLYEGLSVTGNSYNLGNGSSYTYATTSLRAAEFLATNVTNTNPAHVSIVDPRGSITGIAWPWYVTGPVASFLNWGIDNCYPDHASDRIETTIYSFANNFSLPDVQKTVSVCDCRSDSFIDSCSSLNLENLSPNRYYKFVFRPLDADASWLRFYLETESIFSETLTQVKGKYKNSEYLLQAKMSALKPTSDIFSFVIFSEEELIKGL